jgi:ATP-dependent helicase YprA (DUF1998 family)
MDDDSNDDSEAEYSAPDREDGNDVDDSGSEMSADDLEQTEVLTTESDEQLRTLAIEKTIRITGMTPRDFQVDTAVALHKRRDVVLVAGTGFGKTLAFVMPCFLWKRNVAVILAPLNALQEEQASFIVL